MNVAAAWEPDADTRVVCAVLTKTRGGPAMFYVYELPREQNERPITVAPFMMDDAATSGIFKNNAEYDDADIDFVDDSLLNTAPHNFIEKQLLRGDVVGLALMSGAIIWSAMGAFG